MELPSGAMAVPMAVEEVKAVWPALWKKPWAAAAEEVQCPGVAP